MIIDSHAHLYQSEYNDDLSEVIQRAKNAGVSQVVLANVDSSSIEDIVRLTADNPSFFSPTIGLHPTSVKKDYLEELAVVKHYLDNYPAFCAIGETGLDLYWDKSYLKEQIFSFEQHIKWAIEYDLPLILHVREAFDQAYEVLQQYKGEKLRGIFHSFGGSVKQARQIMELKNFKMGINGIVTFKNSKLDQTLAEVPLEYIVLETDAPFLTPSPHRGKRNEPAYLELVISKLSEIYQQKEEFIAKKTSENCVSILKTLSLPSEKFV
jgi:TatD DNase family protein